MLSNPVHSGVLHHHAFQPSAIHHVCLLQAVVPLCGLLLRALHLEAGVHCGPLHDRCVLWWSHRHHLLTGHDQQDLPLLPLHPHGSAQHWSGGWVSLQTCFICSKRFHCIILLLFSSLLFCLKNIFEANTAELEVSTVEKVGFLVLVLCFVLVFCV